MKTYGRADVSIHIFLTSALIRYKWSVSHPGRFNLGEEAPGTHCVSPRVSLDAVDKRTFYNLQGLNTDSSSAQPVATRFTCSAIPVPYYNSIMFHL
jgi:hypothetical protein